MKRAAACIALTASCIASAQNAPVINTVVDCRMAPFYISQLENILRSTPEPSIIRTIGTFESMSSQEQRYKQRVGEIKTRIWIVRSSCQSF